ncbi:MAG: hypothetical protein M0D57_14020 [Sphingobacteriales bacterium JAD_PAG50586_3]|nr:MAG: hypothetical protein M0D57_14020 [Sphingobacteriales bacterium JAD_PAG50586_3]
MRLALLHIFLCFAFVVKGQNLVQNPSFEEYTECPCFDNFCTPAIIPFWELSTDKDFYGNACHFADTYPGCCSVPYNPAGGGCFQYPHDGDGFIALETYKNENSFFETKHKINCSNPWIVPNATISQCILLYAIAAKQLLMI